MCTYIKGVGTQFEQRMEQSLYITKKILAIFFLLIFTKNDYGDREEDSSSHYLYFLLLGNLVFDSRFVL